MNRNHLDGDAENLAKSMGMMLFHVSSGKQSMFMQDRDIRPRNAAASGCPIVWTHVTYPDLLISLN